MPSADPSPRCSVCNATVADGDAYCHHCGGQILRTDGSGRPVGSVEPLLAEANLLRMRGRWDDAEARCVEVMRADPNNVHAHSLLGDIFRDQGRYDDAAQWYQLALDLRPDSDADRTKLASIEEQRSRRAASGAPSGAGPSTQKLAGLPPTVWLRSLWAIVVVFLVAVAAVLLTRPHPTRTRPFTPTGTVAEGPPSQGTAQHPPEVPTPSAQALPSRQVPAASPGARAPVAAVADPDNLATREAEVAQAVVRNVPATLGFSVASVMLDPRDDQATISLLYRGPLPAPSSPQDPVLQGAFAAVSAAFAADPAMARASVSVRVVDASGKATPVFAADIDRSAALALPANTTEQQALAAFTRIWRGSATRVPGGP